MSDYANIVVGDVVPRKYMLNVNNFDGQLFQWLYLNGKATNSVDCFNQLFGEDKHREINKIYNFATNNGNKIKD